MTDSTSSDSSTGYEEGDLVAGRYLICTELGRGGMGAVYEVEHVRSGQRFALKTLYQRFGKSSEVMRRFEREAKATNLLSHPHIVEVLDFGALETGAPFLVMEVLRGSTLADLVDKGRIEPLRGLRIIGQMLDALAHAHTVGIVHRDLKPENVMLVDDAASGDFVKLLDFGIAKVVGEAAAEVGSDSLTLVGTAFGTPEYMAPEQALGVPADHRADLYSTGILLFEVLTGQQPFKGPTPMAVARMQVHAKPPTLREAVPDHEWSDELEHLLARALAKQPQERYQSAGEMLEAIATLVHAMEGSRAPDGASAVIRPQSPDRRAVAAVRRLRARRIARVALPVLLVVASAVVILVARHGREPTAQPGTSPGSSVLGAPKSELAVRAERALDSGDFRGARELLANGLVSPAGDHDAYGHFLLGRAHTAVGAHADAITEYVLATRLAPELLASQVLRTDVTTILNGKDKTAALRALELVSERPVPGADELIVDQASRGKQREVRQRARALAREKGIAARVDALESYSLDLEQDATCNRRREAVGKLRALRRKAAVPALQRAVELRGSSSGERPNACLEKAAAAAIRYLEDLR